MHSFTEENYLKAIYKLQETNGEVVATSALAQVMGVHAPSVTDMLKRMAGKKLVTYQKSKGFKLSEKGKKVAVGIIRNHRLWEVFLVDKLGFRWDEVHDIAEQLEHIHSEDLVNKLDAFLGYPKADPHGDPIPDANGVLPKSKSVLLSTLKAGDEGTFTGVTDHSPAFLNHLDKSGISLGNSIKVKGVEEYDQTYTLQLKGKKEVVVSFKVANSLLVRG
ncbi:metal-dependent transcriptional regulator [Sediminibacterium sp.]|uniref:metal-dependent transcriptional regulator n=1 Tax=Sediminibacterium sp. TaxID=1917865 RepID=UPI0025DD7808|nr:metal-dependent transcriptional regulator [Sediminibacterium sp.]MDP3393322.1 metal-dependent transcriptional regulator [Sediminibacterium sp.]MDP3567924.1 metal-dependent transcriptional regulator [Sediminibacterium sp.]